MLTTSHTLLERLRMESPPPGAWERFFKLYAPEILGWARQQGLQQTDAEDVTQQVLLKVHASLVSYDKEKGRFRSWLRQIFENTCVDFYRKRKPALPGSALLDGLVAADAKEEAEYRQRLAVRAQQLIRREFSDRDSLVFTQLIDGAEAQEVAEKNKMSLSAVYKVKSRILARLRAELNGLLD
jgi:RNA polymerase sigma-70 factor (ECF subfamily)